MRNLLLTSVCASILLSACATDNPQDRANDTSSGSVSPAFTFVKEDARFSLQNGEVFDSHRTDGQPLLMNAEYVDGVRTGPDGRTLHFHLSKVPENEAPAACALIDDAGGIYDYNHVSWADSLRGCGMYQAAGMFLKHSPFISYIRSSSGTLSLVVKDDAGTDMSLPVADDIWKKMLAADEFVETSRLGDTSFEGLNLSGIEAQDGTLYYYPQKDALLKNDVIVLAFGGLLMAVDTKQEKIIGSYVLSNPPHDIVSHAYWFLADATGVSPYLVIESGWEGSRGYEAIVDVSSGSLAIEPLYDKEQHWRSGYAIPEVEWNDGAMTIHFFNEVDITDKLTAAERRDIMNMETQVNTTPMEQRLKEAYGYLDVLCQQPGMGDGGCIGLTLKEDLRRP